MINYIDCRKEVKQFNTVLTSAIYAIVRQAKCWVNNHASISFHYTPRNMYV